SLWNSLDYLKASFIFTSFLLLCWLNCKKTEQRDEWIINIDIPPLAAHGSEWRFRGTLSGIRGCSSIPVGEVIEKQTLIGSGWNKNVFKFGYFAVKRLNLNGVAYQRCLSDVTRSASQ
ncbi:hypothetical protein AAVH_38621, partial [Aphelenchoides avenae]